jgi:hypothetical protein
MAVHLRALLNIKNVFFASLLGGVISLAVMTANDLAQAQDEPQAVEAAPLTSGGEELRDLTTAESDSGVSDPTRLDRRPGLSPITYAPEIESSQR